MNMYETVKIKFTSASPLLMHNRRLANPMDEYAIALGQLTAKGAKKLTQADRIEMSRLEFYGGMYVDEDGHPCIPGEIVEATVGGGAKKFRKGKDFTAALVCDGNWPLTYSGPKNLDAMWKDGSFVDVRMAVINQRSILRTRPVFRDWSFTAELSYLPDALSLSDVERALDFAGTLVGLCDYRPRYGRFQWEKVA